MKENLKTFALVVAAIAFFAFVICMSTVQVHNEKDCMVEYCARHGQSVEKTESPFWNHGPYWYQKNDHIYRTVAETEHGAETTYWFRFRLWRTPAVERQEPSGGYTELDFNE